MSTFKMVWNETLDHFTFVEIDEGAVIVKQLSYGKRSMDTFLKKVCAILKEKDVQWEGPTLIHESYPDEVDGWDRFRHTTVQEGWRVKSSFHEFVWYIHPTESQRLFCLFTDGSFYKVSAEEGGEPPLVRSFHTEKEASAALFNMVRAERLRALL